MAEIELLPLDELLGSDETVELNAAIKELGAPRLPRPGDEAAIAVSDSLDDDIVAEFLDRLAAEDIAADLYLPIEFEGVIELTNWRVGSAPALLDVLEELREDFFEDEEEEEEEEEEEDEEDDAYLNEDRVLAAKLRHVWSVLHKGAQAAVTRRLVLHIDM